ILSLLALQAPVAGDLRIVAALLHVIRCVERMGDQCVNIAKLVPLSGYEAPKDKDILDAIERMGRLARSQVWQAKQAFAGRNSELAHDLVRQDTEINRLNREIFRRAVEIGDKLEMREWAMFMILVARCLERIGDNRVDIAEQTVVRGHRPVPRVHRRIAACIAAPLARTCLAASVSAYRRERSLARAIETARHRPAGSGSSREPLLSAELRV